MHTFLYFADYLVPQGVTSSGQVVQQLNTRSSMAGAAAMDTPLMKQYSAIKAKYLGALLLFRVGDF
ncbi:MAG TPA: hypothetical protein DHV26_14015, partial [Cytophagales bacterium]|nr:hypothetical protein [Cytophagales bacterium]